ncbi:MAG TPA: hypothetical protein VHM26_11705 [Chitinophagaceae bacterium]|nr:hypothetical protein [Chitinophagaceae bacterium]
MAKRKWWRKISRQRLFIYSLDLLWIILVSGFMWFFIVIVL